MESNEQVTFQAPLPVNGSNSTTEFATPTLIPRTNLIQSRLSHYITCICNDLENYERDKTQQKTKTLLKLYDNTPLLDIQVARRFTSLLMTAMNHNKIESIVDMEKFSKVMKLLENSIIVCTELDLIEHYSQTRNKTALFSMLNLLSETIEIAGILFDILIHCRLDKQFVSRHLITHCLHFIKNQLDYIVYPFTDLNEFEEQSSFNLNTRTVYDLIRESPKEKRLVSLFIPNITKFLRRAHQLIQREELDDDVLVTVAYISMAPFFHDQSEQTEHILEDSDTFSPYEQLKFSALDILKHIFSSYPQHRRWIFEEILTSLGSLTAMNDKRSYRLHDNQSIHVISALFMELVQCSSNVSNLSGYRNWFRKWNIKYQKAQKSNDAEKLKLLDDQLLTKAANAWRHGAEAAANSASFFLEFLMSKCKSKRKDVYSLTEYRQLLSNTLEDVMKVFNDPAWPVAELIIKVFSRILIALLEGDHSDQYLKTLAVEWLGIIACKIRTSQDLLSGDNTKVYRPDWIFDLNDKLPTQINKDTSVESIELLNQCRKKLLDSVMEEHAGSSVVQFYLVNWGFTESVLWTKANKGWKVDKKSMLESISTTEDKKADMVQEVDDQDVTMDQEEKWPLATVHILQDTCKYYWLSSLGLDCSFPQPSKPYCFPEMSRSDVASIVELLASRQTLYTSYNFILSELFTCLDKDAVYLRVKSLKAIGRISMQVPEIFEENRVYTSVVQRVHDNSPSVRDAAIEIVAKYLSQQHDVPLKLYELVSGRIMDTATNVRKRLVKLLRELYFKFTDEEVRVDIASKLIMRIADNEVSIGDLALKATQDILFMPFKEVEKDGNDYFGYSYANAPKQRKQRINKLTKVITGAVAKLDPSLNGQNAALSQIVQRTIDGADGKLKEWYEKIFQWIIDSLFDQMVLLDEENNTTEFISYLATVHSFIKSCPDLLRTTQISMLQPYLTISEIDDWTRAYYVLVIYRDVLPNMKYHERGFIEILERILVQLLTTCPLELTSSAASCLCVIVDRISRRYSILIKILGSCVLKLRQVRDAILHYSITEKTFTGTLKMLLLCGLLCQHFEFDKRRQEEPEAMSGLDAVYRGSIGTLVFDLLHFFAGDERMNELGEQGMTIRLTALQALGYFYCSYPTFIISNTSTELMDKIFNQGTNAMKTQLMRVFQEFLSAEDKRIEKRQHEEEEKEEIINLDILLGNTEEYAELGVNGSLMQRYLPKILEYTLNKTSGLLYAAFEVVSSVIHRGLAHPVLCMPVIIAAETSPDALLRTKAYYTHKYAHDKYGVLLYMQMSEYISTSFQYQKLLFGSNMKGYGKRGGDSRTESVLALTYTVLKDKTKAKFDFIYALIRPFMFDLKTTAPEEIELDYLKYLAENLMVFDFCTTDELLFVVYHIDRLIMTLGTDLLSFVQFLRKQGKLGEEDEMDHDLLMASKLSLVLCMLMLLKKLLIELYDIPDEQICKYNPNNKHRPRDITKDPEMPQFIDWEEELLYFKHCTLDRHTGIDACSKFEYLIMNDTTALVMTDES